MSQSVDRLKELLFDSETLAIQDLARRLDGFSESESRSRADIGRRIDSLADLDAQAREELKARLEEVYNRAGNTEHLTKSVTEVISEVLRRAEVERHAELSQSLAPLLISTIKTELRNSQDQMVEALYPITGRLVKSYVASAIQDLTAQMNRRLEQNPVMLRVQSLMTGRPVGELLLASTRDFAVKELYLIRRGSGELVAHWPDTGSSGREHAVSGVLAAVNEFASEAFSATEQNLRHIDLGGEVVYLRGSPIYLLAARCSGQAPDAIEQSLDDALLTAVERQLDNDGKSVPGTDATAITSASLTDVGNRLSARVAEQMDDYSGPSGKGALKFAATIILLPIIGWFAWTLYSDYAMARTRSLAERIVAADPAMLGYPVQISVGNRGRELEVSGLTPSHQAKSRIVNDLGKSLPGVALNDKLTVVAGSDIVIPDVSPELARVREEISVALTDVARAALARATKRAENRLDRAIGDLKNAAAQQTGSQQFAGLDQIATDLDGLRTELISAGNINDVANASETYRVLTDKLNSAGTKILSTIGAPADALPAATNHANDAGGTIDSAAENFAAEAERVAALASTVAAARFMTPAPPPPAPAPPHVTVTVPAEPTPRDRLDAWARSHAIFFSAELDYRNDEETQRWLTELSGLLKASPTLLRIVGYTDETGTSVRNVTLAQGRADKVRNDLTALGAPAGMLVTVGRASALDLSDVRGTGTPNRRVEFEIGFEGEAAK